VTLTILFKVTPILLLNVSYKTLQPFIWNIFLKKCFIFGTFDCYRTFGTSCV